MTHHQLDLVRADREQWLKFYYFIRAAFSVAWVVAAFAVGPSSAAIAGALLVLYPAWDAAANFVDALRSGGLAQNRTQALNVLVSLVTTVAVLDEHERSARRLRGLGDPVRIAPARNRDPSLEKFRRAVGHGA